jgi:hypothetical protein
VTLTVSVPSTSSRPASTGSSAQRGVELAEVEQRDLLRRQVDAEVLAEHPDEDLVADAGQVALEGRAREADARVDRRAVGELHRALARQVQVAGQQGAARHRAGVLEVDAAGRVDGDAEGLRRGGLLGAAVEQLLGGEVAGDVLAVPSAAAAGDDQRRERGDQGDDDRSSARAGHQRGIAWPPMRGRART